MATSTQLLPPSEASVQKNLWRLVQWAGLALLAMSVGAGIGIWVLGPSLLGQALGKARIQTLNTHIRGVFEHTGGCDLRWGSTGTVSGLQLHDEQGDCLVQGDLVVPALSSPQWRQGLLPSEAELRLDELVLRFDHEGICSLLDRLASRSGNDVGGGGSGSPFANGSLLQRAAHYTGIVAALRIADERAGGVPLQLSNVDFDLKWEPQGECHLHLECALPSEEGGDAGQFKVNLRWTGMGEGFDLLSLQGTASLLGATANLGSFLGIPQGLTAVFGSRLNVSLEMGGVNTVEPDQGGVLVTCKAQGERLYVGQIDGFFTGDQWTFRKDITQARDGSGGVNTELATLKVDHSQAGYGLVLSHISQLFFGGRIPMQLRTAPEASPAWSVDVIEFVSGVAPRPAHLPLLEGWLATSRMHIDLHATGQHQLAALEGGPRAQPEPLEQSSIRWTFDGAQSAGRGEFHAVPTEAQKQERRAVAIALSGTPQIGPLDFEELKLAWKTEGPLMTSGMRPIEAQIKHLPSVLLRQLVGDLGWSLAQTFGSTFEVSFVEELVPARSGSADSEVEGWRIRIGGQGMQPENPIYLYTDGQALWSEPGLASEVTLFPGRPGGVFESWVQPCFPWFEELGGQGDQIGLRFEDLVAERGEAGWRITAGRFSVMDLEFDYTIDDPWLKLWGDPDSDLEFSAQFSVQGDRVEFEDLKLPLGSFEGNVELDRQYATLRLRALNEVSSSFLGLGASLKVGSQLLGPFDRLEWTQPVSGSGQ